MPERCPIPIVDEHLKGFSLTVRVSWDDTSFWAGLPIEITPSGVRDLLLQNADDFEYYFNYPPPEMELHQIEKLPDLSQGLRMAAEMVPGLPEIPY
jgi:hypothetical protein